MGLMLEKIRTQFNNTNIIIKMTKTDHIIGHCTVMHVWWYQHIANHANSIFIFINQLSYAYLSDDDVQQIFKLQ